MQAAGEWLLHDVTHIVPTPYNGQMIAIMALNATLLGLALMILYTWVGSSTAVLAAAGVTLVFLAEHKQLVVFHLDSVRMLRAVPALPLRPCLGFGRPVAPPVDHGARRRPAGARARGVSRPGPAAGLVALIRSGTGCLRIAATCGGHGLEALFLASIVSTRSCTGRERIRDFAYSHRAPNPLLDAVWFLVQFWGPAAAA